ncbi:hypothetical protein TMEN_4939 [Trichophyton mentagrophytes]|nr:hypothetical protein TMEN_4939 [Trichophyton mentagrophytes]
MAICITFGTHEFTSQLQGYENVTAQCQNCRFSPSALLYELLPAFYLLGILNTVFSKPLIPLAMHKYKEVYCHICRFSQDMSMRPDVESQGPGGHGQGPPPGGPPQQYYGPPPGQQGPPQQYQPPQQPGYK